MNRFNFLKLLKVEKADTVHYHENESFLKREYVFEFDGYEHTTNCIECMFRIKEDLRNMKIEVIEDEDN